MTLKLQFALKDLNQLLITSVGSPAKIDDIVYFASLAQLNGFKFTAAEFKRLIDAKPSIESLADNTLAIKQIMGTNVSHAVLLGSFPKQPSRIDEALSPIISFYNLLLGDAILRDGDTQDSEKEVFKYVNLTVTDNIDEKLQEVLLSKTPLKLDHEALVISMFKENDPVLDQIDHHDIALKEILARYIARGYSLNKDLKAARTATDVVRAIALLSGQENAKLDDQFKVKSLSNPIRRLVVKDLDRVGNISDLTLNKGLFKRLFKIIHVHDKKFAEYENIRALAKTIQTVNNPSTIRTVLHETNISDYNPFVKSVLQSNPNEFGMRLDTVLRHNEHQQDVIIRDFIEIIDQVGNKILLRLWGHLMNRTENQVKRAVYTKGVNGRVTVLDKPLYAFDSKVVETLVSAIKTSLSNRFKTFDSVYIDKRLYDIAIPTSLSAVDSSKPLAKGSRVDLPEGNTIRTFIHWKGYIDLDLSVSFWSDNFERNIDHCSFSGLRNGYANHSGDVRSAPSGASEFIDIDIKKATKFGVRYAIMYVNSYSGESFDDIQELFAGFMMRSDKEQGKLFDARTVDHKFSVVGSNRGFTPLILDLVERKMIWVGLASRVEPMTTVNSYDFNEINYIMSRSFVSVGDLLEVHSNEIIRNVEDIKDDTVKFDVEYAYNVTEINSKLI